MSAATTTVPAAGRGFFPLDEQLELWEKQWSEQVAKQAVWLSCLVPFAQVEQILREVGGIDISQSSVLRRVERWGGRLQAIEVFQQAKAYGFEDPETLDPNRSRGRMGVAMDGTMIHIRGEGWKELKVGCVFDIRRSSAVVSTKCGGWPTIHPQIEMRPGFR